MSYRIEQLNQMIREEVSPMLSTIRDKYLGMITVVGVEVNPDVTQAVVWLTFLAAESENDKDLLKALSHYTRDIQRTFGKKMFLKRVPKLIYKVDHSDVFASRIFGVFDKLEKGEDLPIDIPLTRENLTK